MKNKSNFKIKPSEFYNEITLERIADKYSNSDIEHSLALNRLKNNINTICISDVDGTYINTNDAVRNAQAKALSKIAEIPFSEAYKQLETEGLKKAIEKIMSLDEFFKGPYKTFNPYKAAADGSMTVFQDAIQFTQSGFPTIAISNSSQKATEEKLEASGIKNEFVGIHAEYLKEKAKPNLYLAEKALTELDQKGFYNPKQTIIVIGDQKYDIEFGNNIRRNLHQNTISVLINRNGNDKIIDAKPDYIVKSFDELYDLR